MNDKRQNYRSFYHPKEVKKQQNIEELLAIMTSFLSKNKLKSADWIIVNRLIQQLEANKNNMSAKVFRALKNRFENIQQQYQK
jgi:hypothetical protein